MAKRMQKIHTKLQPSQETDPNSNIEKGKTSAEFPSKLNSIRIEHVRPFQMLGDPKKTTGSHIKTTHTPRQPKEPTSGPLTMIGCRQDTSERPNSNHTLIEIDFMRYKDSGQPGKQQTPQPPTRHE